MDILDNVKLDQQSNSHNDVRFESLSRKRSSNWRPPGKGTVTGGQPSHTKGLHMKAEEDIYLSRCSTHTQQKQNHTYECTRIDKDYTFIGDMENKYKRENENRLEWPRSRHKDSGELTSRDTSVYKNISDFNLQHKMCATPHQMSNSNLHSAYSDIHTKFCDEHVVNGDDFMFRKISNLFFRRNQIRWQYNFFKWLNGCTKTLFIGGGMIRYKKTMSYLGGASTIMLLLIFSLLISGPGEAYPVEGGFEIQKLTVSPETSTSYARIVTDAYANINNHQLEEGEVKGKNQFGLKYLDTSSLEFGRKILRNSEKLFTAEPSADQSRVTYDSNNKKSQDKTISSSLSVSSSETVQIETSLNDQDLVKPSRVKKRNFASKDPLTSSNIFSGHIDSNNFRHTTKAPSSIQDDNEKVKPPLALANSVGVEFGAKTKTTRTGQISTSTAKDFTDDDLQQDNNLRTSTSKVIPFGQKTKIISSTSTPIANPDKSTSPRTTTVLYKISNSTTPKGSTAKLRFGQKFPKTTPSFQSTLLHSNKGMDDKLSTTTTPVTTTQPDEATTKSPSTHSTTSTKKRVTKSTTVTSTPLNTSRRRSTTQTTVRTVPISRKTTNPPAGSIFSTVLPPRLPSAQPLIRSSKKGLVTSEKTVTGNKSGNDAVIRFVSTASPRPFNTKKDFRDSTDFMKIVKKKVAKGSDSKRIPYTIRTIIRRPATTTSSSLLTPRSVEITSSANSSFTGSRPGSSFIVKKARPLDGSGRRVRLRDSLLARVQGKYKARSTTVKPITENRNEKESNDKSKASSGMLMLKRSRVRPRNEVQNNNTTTTTIKPLPVVNANATASPLFSLKKELKGVAKIKLTSLDAIRSQPQVKSTTTEAVNLVVRRYETPPPRFAKPLSQHVSKLSKVTKAPKLRLSKVTKPSKRISTTTSSTPVKKVKSDSEEVSTETTVSISVGSSSSLVSAESDVPLPDVRLKIKSKGGERRRNNDTSEFEKEERYKPLNEEILTPPPRTIERPQGLEQELLAAIRRKISKTTSTKSTRVDSAERKPSDSRPSIHRPKFRITQKANSPRLSNIDIDVSPASNSVSSTQHPPFFRPIPSFPNPSIGKSSTGKPLKTRLPQQLQPPRVRFYVRVPGGDGGIGTKSHGHDSSIRIPNFSHIQGKLKRLNAAITESFLKPKKTIDSDSVKQERKKVKDQSTINTEISTVSHDSEVLPEEAKATVQKTSNEDPPNSSKSKIVSDSQPIIITSTSISISLEENTANSYTTTVNPNNPNLNVLSATSSSVASSSTLKPKTNKGLISSQDYIRLRTTTKDTRRPHKIAKKTQTYLDKLRQRNVVVTPSTTTQASTTLAILQDDYHGESSKEHPTAHLRPLNDEIENPPEEPKSGNIGSDRSNIRGVQLVTPVYGEFTPSPYDIESNRKLNFSRLNDAGNVSNEDNPDGGENAEESVIHDITGTTVYVVGVICVIPAAGLVAWVVRYVVKKKDTLGNSGSENCSETGLNCPLSRGGGSSGDRDRGDAEDLLQQQGRSHGIGQGQLGQTSHHGALHALAHASQSHIRRGTDRDNNISSEDSDDQVDGEIGGGNVDDVIGGTIKRKTQEILLANSAWQFSRQNLRLLTVLGEGNFGRVWKAEADSICGYEGTALVAVKTSKENAPEKEKSDLLQEIQIMQQVGATHPNIVTLLGVCTEKEPYLLILEYVMYGKLLTHLREQRSRGQTSLLDEFGTDDILGGDSLSRDGIDNEDTGGSRGSSSNSITAKDLTKYAYGVAKGMEYLVSKSIIHRDLAARNILLDHNKVCKISDFGLSRNLGDTGSEMYEQKTKGALPIRWMAPESLYFSVFTPKSDVWSFGILMWEIVTLGSTPYPGMGAREVMRRVRDGYRLERPSHCHPELYKIISKCWAGDMNKRPDFTELRQELAKLLENQHGYIDLQNIPENKYYSMTQAENEEEKI